MEITELMIGDFVKIKDMKDPVKWIFGLDAFLNKVYYLDGEELLFTSVGNVLPIPLTEKILNKNGFEKDDCGLRYTLYFDNRRVRSSSIEVVPQEEDWSELEMTIHSGKADINSVVEYVHELQHALRLCGIDENFRL
jgi:hypothetical protein